MKMFRHNWSEASGVNLGGSRRIALLLVLVFGGWAQSSYAQAVNQESLPERIRKLSEAMARAQAHLDQTQREMNEMRQELLALQKEMTQSDARDPVPSPSDALAADSQAQSASNELSSAVQEIQERLAVDESQIATHDQTKIESASKYPVKVTGMLLLNGFVNTSAVDMAATPTVAVYGGGSVGATMRQTVLGFDAYGPHLFGARSSADLRVDFYGSPAPSGSTTNYTGSLSANSPFLRLRTAHAALQWDRTQAYFALDRPIISPEAPTSLTAVAQPALAWSGNLWTWNPQAGITQTLGSSGLHALELQAALIDVGDAPLTPVIVPSGLAANVPPTSAQASSRPGVEARIGLLGPAHDDDRSHLGFGGYFAPHLTSLGRSFDSWAATVDMKTYLFARLQLSGSFYRGLGLGGLGGGAYKDVAYKANPNTGGYFVRALDDVGGWAQLKEKFSERLEFNAAYGMDNVFAGQMRHYIVQGGTMYQNLTINRTFTGNAIYAPSAYLLFSLEYRHLMSSPITGAPAQSNVIGLGAGYKF